MIKMTSGTLADKIAQAKRQWAEFEPKTKLMVMGTVAIIAASIFLATSNVIETLFGENRTPVQEATIISEEEELIPEDAEPIAYANEETQMVSSLMGILTNEECAWVATDDPIGSLRFTDKGFEEYTGDIKASHSLEFYSIRVTENGRSGVWRITYPDGTMHDARFTFTHDTERGVYVIASSAFPTYKSYETRAFTSDNILTDW